MLTLIIVVSIVAYVAGIVASVKTLTQTQLEIQYNSKASYSTGYYARERAEVQLDSTERWVCLIYGTLTALIWPLSLSARGYYRFYNRGLDWRWLRAPSELANERAAELKAAEDTIKEFDAKIARAAEIKELESMPTKTLPVETVSPNRVTRSESDAEHLARVQGWTVEEAQERLNRKRNEAEQDKATHAKWLASHERKARIAELRKQHGFI